MRRTQPRCRASCCSSPPGAIYDEHGDTVEVHGASFDALEDIIEAANGQTVLVAYWYRHDRERIQRRFPQARELKASADIEAWNRGDIPLGLIHPASAGHGLNLQSGGHLLVWFSLTWSLELYQQTNARLYRQGQAEPVTITHPHLQPSTKPSSRRWRRRT